VAVHAGARLTRAAAILWVAWLAAAAAGRADAGTLTFSPERTTIAFTLPATLHQVNGTLKLRSGRLQFDETSGAASGTLVVDARSAQTGNGRRDRTMHAEVLESEKHPEIVFEASRLELERQAADRAEAVLHGVVRIHGDTRTLAVPAHLARDGDLIHVRATFQVPYVAWGMKDVSNVVLRVAPEVEVVVDAQADYVADAPPAAPGEAPP
jgi:polyisoprenoid-binding protein YceI